MCVTSSSNKKLLFYEVIHKSKSFQTCSKSFNKIISLQKFYLPPFKERTNLPPRHYLNRYFISDFHIFHWRIETKRSGVSKYLLYILKLVFCKYSYFQIHLFDENISITSLEHISPATVFIVHIYNRSLPYFARSKNISFYVLGIFLLVENISFMCPRICIEHIP